MVALAALVAVVALASGHPIGGHASANRRGVAEVVSVVAALALGFALVVWALVVAFVRFSRRHRDPEEPVFVAPPMSRWWILVPLGMVAGLIALVTIVILNSAHRVHRLAPMSPALGPGVNVPAHGSGGGGSDWVVIVIAVAIGAIAAVSAAIVIHWRARRHRHNPDRATALRDAVGQAQADLDSSDDPRAAVLRAYARMETALAGNGVARGRSEAPREYLARALTVVGAGAGAERLTTSFEEARYSAHEIGESARADARTALGEVRRQLESSTADGMADP